MPETTTFVPHAPALATATRDGAMPAADFAKLATLDQTALVAVQTAYSDRQGPTAIGSAVDECGVTGLAGDTFGPFRLIIDGSTNALCELSLFLSGVNTGQDGNFSYWSPSASGIVAWLPSRLAGTVNGVFRMVIEAKAPRRGIGRRLFTIDCHYTNGADALGYNSTITWDSAAELTSVTAKSNVAASIVGTTTIELIRNW